MTGSRRATAALASGSAASGLLAYVAFALVTRGLGAEAAAPVSVLWTWWAFAGAALTFPLQHWITRTVAADGTGAVRRAAPPICVAVLLIAVVLGGLAWVARADLFHRSDGWFPLMVALVTVGSALIGVTRGGLGARGRFVAVAWSLVVENGLRCVLIAALLVAGATDPVAYGLCLVAGHLAALLWPSALRFPRTPVMVTGSVGPLVFLSGTGLGQLVSQAVLTGGPVVLALTGGSPAEVTSLFAALALFRAPYMLVLGSVPPLTVRLTRLRVAGDSAALRRLMRLLLGSTAVGVVLAAVLGAWIGPGLLVLVFGNTVEVGAGQAALVAVGCTLAVANLLLTITALAHDRPAALARAWVTGLAAATVAFAAAMVLTSASSAVGITVASFVVAETVTFGALLCVSARA